MFRPNRVGTPYIADLTGLTSSVAWTPATATYAGNTFFANTINAVPQADFGQSAIHWAGSAVAVAANNKFAIVQQFSVTTPLNGDTVGLELTGNLTIPAFNDTLLTPFMGRLADAPVQVLAGCTLSNLPCNIGPPSEPMPQASIAMNRSHQYRTQAVLKGTSGAALAGTYVHGILIYTTTALSMSWLDANFGIRQLNDQQNVGYRDTLK